MTMQIRYSNLLKETKGIIVHGVNAQGKMNSGFARQLRNKYPKVFSDYINHYKEYGLDLGNIIITKINKDLIIVSGVTQFQYGRELGVRYVDYDAISLVFKKVLHLAYIHNLPVYFPKIGCGLGGGNWEDVKDIVEKELIFIPEETFSFDWVPVKQIEFCLFDYKAKS